MLDAAPNRTCRLLVLLVELDGVTLERAAAALMLTVPRAREQLASLRTIARQAKQQQRRAAQLAELAGVSQKMRKSRRASDGQDGTASVANSVNPLNNDLAPGAERVSYEQR